MASSGLKGRYGMSICYDVDDDAGGHTVGSEVGLGDGWVIADVDGSFSVFLGGLVLGWRSIVCWKRQDTSLLCDSV